MKKIPPPDLNILRKQLIDVCNTLDKMGVEYHLEGGTLLGIVRDGDILPWDKDTDISIMARDAYRLPELMRGLRMIGWRCKLRRFETDNAFARKGDARVLKVKRRSKWFFTQDKRHMLDVFVKHSDGKQVFWQAGNCFMAVDAKYYEGHDEISWKGMKVKIPKFHEAFLEEKYGNWRVPVKDWDFTMEKTIFAHTPDASAEE